MSFAYATRVDLSMIKQLLKEELVTPVTLSFSLFFFLHFTVDPVASSRLGDADLQSEGQNGTRRSKNCKHSCDFICRPLI